MVVLGSATAGVCTAISAGDDREFTPVEQLHAEPTGPGRFAHAFGIDSSEATEVFTLGNGATISVAETSRAKCLFAVKDGGTGETCDTDVAINAGTAVAVTDECGSAGDGRMEITGLAPAGAATARLDISDDSTESTVVDRGAFRFEGANPTEGSPYPTSVTWLRGNDSSITTASLPVNGDEFCIPSP